MSKDEVQHLYNLQSKIKRKKSQLCRLENRIANARAQLQAINRKVNSQKNAGKYSVKNMKRRETRMQSTLKKTKSQLKEAEAKIFRLTLTADTLGEMIFDSDDKARREQKMKSHHKQRISDADSNLTP